MHAIDACTAVRAYCTGLRYHHSVKFAQIVFQAHGGAPP
jgi:hypothetical protein